MTGGDEEHGPWRGHLRAVSLDILAKCVPMAVASQRRQSPDSRDAVTGQISRALRGPGTTCRPELTGNGNMQGSPQLRDRRRSGGHAWSTPVSGGAKEPMTGQPTQWLLTREAAGGRVGHDEGGEGGVCPDSRVLFQGPRTANQPPRFPMMLSVFNFRPLATRSTPGRARGPCQHGPHNQLPPMPVLAFARCRRFLVFFKRSRFNLFVSLPCQHCSLAVIMIRRHRLSSCATPVAGRIVASVSSVMVDIEMRGRSTHAAEPFPRPNSTPSLAAMARISQGRRRQHAG